MVQPLPGDFIDIQGDKNISTDKKNLGLIFGQHFPRPRITAKRVMVYFFK